MISVGSSRKSGESLLIAFFAAHRFLFFFAIFLSHVVGSGRISRELNVGVGSSLDSVGNADLVVFGFSFVETKCVFLVASES